MKTFLTVCALMLTSACSAADQYAEMYAVLDSIDSEYTQCIAAESCNQAVFANRILTDVLENPQFATQVVTCEQDVICDTRFKRTATLMLEAMNYMWN